MKATLTLDEELNYTEFPMEEPPNVQFEIPFICQQSSSLSPIFKDHDSVSTFHSKHPAMPDIQSKDEEMEDAPVQQSNQQANTHGSPMHKDASL